MRLLVSLVLNLLAVVYAALLYPLRLLGRPKADYLAVELTGDLSWRRAGKSGLFRFGRRRHSPLRPDSLETLFEALDAVEKSERLRGVILKIEGFTASGAKLLSLRKRLEALRARGKEVVFYGRAVTMREYALMAAGSKIVMAPGGHVDLAGVAAEVYVMAEPLAKAGIHAHFLRRGEYKTAPELFTDREVSPAQKKTLSTILEESFGRTVNLVSSGRGRTPDEVRALIDEGPFSSAMAKEKGLIDEVGDGEDLELLFAPKDRPTKGKEKDGEPRAKLMPIASVPRLKAFRPKLRRMSRRPQIAVVPVDGVIKLGESVEVPLSPKAAGSDSVVKALRIAREDDSLKAIVLHVDSRGGSALASELIHKAVVRAAKKKPVLAYVENVAASGGYMAAVGAKEIIAAPQSIVGSIGVFAGKFEAQALLERLGVGKAVVRYGRHANLMSTTEPWTEEERAALDAQIGQTYRDFLQIVADGRKMTVDAVHALGEGRVYTGTRAHELKLVDALGDFEDAVRRATELAGLKEPPGIRVVDLARRSSVPMQLLRGPNGLAEVLESFSRERIFAFEPLWKSWRGL